MEINYKASKKLLEAFEMRTRQRMLKITGREVINEEVLVRSKEIRNILIKIWHKSIGGLACFQA